MSTITTQTRYFQVTCVTTSNAFGVHEGITRLGGDGWSLSRDQMIADIESPNTSNSYYTKFGEKYAWVEVVNGRYGKYLQTRGDGVLNNNLLYLPACLA